MATASYRPGHAPRPLATFLRTPWRRGLWPWSDGPGPPRPVGQRSRRATPARHGTSGPRVGATRPGRARPDLAARAGCRGRGRHIREPTMWWAPDGQRRGRGPGRRAPARSAGQGTEAGPESPPRPGLRGRIRTPRNWSPAEANVRIWARSRAGREQPVQVESGMPVGRSGRGLRGDRPLPRRVR